MPATFELVASAPYTQWQAAGVLSGSPEGTSLIWPGGPVAGTTISSLSTVYILVPIRAYSAGVPFNPTALTVQMAFINGWAKPGAPDWNAASWAWTTAVNGYYAAQCLVGPGTGGKVLAVGTWNVWVQVTASNEVPILNSGGTLTIT